jgi:hypothetical protein
MNNLHIQCCDTESFNLWWSLDAADDAINNFLKLLTENKIFLVSETKLY